MPATNHDSHSEDPSPDEAVLVTGFPSFTAARMTRKVLEADDRASVYLLARDRFATAAEEMLATLPAQQRKRIQVIIGDVCDMDLGLSGAEYRSLANSVTT